MSNIANVFPETCDAIIKHGAFEILESIITNGRNHYALRKSACELLSALCKLYVPFEKVISCSNFSIKTKCDVHFLIKYFKLCLNFYYSNCGQRKIVLHTLKTAIFSESESVLVPTCLALSNFSNKKFVDVGAEVYKRLLHLIE